MSTTVTPPLGTPVPALFSIRAGRSSIGVALRTSIATVTPVVVGHWLGQPLWAWAALGAYTTALADLVDTYERQVRMSVLVTIGSTITAMLGAVGATWPIWAMAVLTFLVAFTGSAVRGLGRTIGTAGFFIIITYVASAGTAAGWHDAFVRAAFVLGGGVWATALILTRWVRGADRPVFMTVAYPYERLARLARLVSRQQDGSARNERDALREHRDVRDAVSLAHDTVARERPGATTMALHTVIDDADHLFGVVLAFGEAVLATPEAERGPMVEVAESIQRLCGALAGTIQHRVPVSDVAKLNDAVRQVDEAIGTACVHLQTQMEFEQGACVRGISTSSTQPASTQPASTQPASAQLASAQPRSAQYDSTQRTSVQFSQPAFARLLIVLSQVAARTMQSVIQLAEIVQEVPVSRAVAPRLDIAVDRAAWITQELRIPDIKRATGSTETAFAVNGQQQSTLWTRRLRTVLDQYATPESPVGRHALRLGIACTIAEVVARLTQLGHGQWVALTVLVVLQPDLGTTFRRGVHRIVGTVVGGMLAAALAAALPSAIVTIFVLFPLLFVTVLLAPVHYALFSMFVTPTFVLFAEPHAGDWRLALTRVVNTCIGGALALIAARVLWPRSERTRVGPYLAAVLRASARYVRVVVDRRAPIGTEEWMTYRAAMGRANTAAEDSVLRWSGEQVRSPLPVRSAASLVLSARGLAAAITWLAIVGDELAEVSPVFLTQLASAMEALAVAMTDGLVPAPLGLASSNGSVLERRLCERASHLHGAAVRFARR